MAAAWNPSVPPVKVVIRLLLRSRMPSKPEQLKDVIRLLLALISVKSVRVSLEMFASPAFAWEAIWLLLISIYSRLPSLPAAGRVTLVSLLLFSITVVRPLVHLDRFICVRLLRERFT